MATPQVDLEVLQRTASRLFRSGPVDEAIAAYERLLSIRPALPNSWFNLALLHRRARMFARSLASCERALALGISQPEEVHLQRGVILSDDLGNADGARDALASALALNPRYVPALLNLGNLEEDVGDKAAAIACYRRVMEIHPTHALGTARLLGLLPAGGEGETLLNAARAQFHDPRTAIAERADLGFAIGAALDRRGCYPEAFQSFSDANLLSGRMAQSSGAAYNPRAQEAMVERLMRSFPSPAAGLQADHQYYPDRAPIFICGMFRSGSTLVEQILSRHHQVEAGGEMSTLPALIRSEFPQYPEAAAAALPEKLREVRRRYLIELRGRTSPDTWATDKRPDNFLHIGLIKTLFPDAKIVHTTRDILDNCLSVFFLHLDPTMTYATKLEHIAHYCRQQERLMRHWRKLYPGDIHRVSYDRLVTNPMPTLEALLNFLRLDLNDGLLLPEAERSVVRTASAWQVREPLYTHASGRWCNYSAQVAPLRAWLRAEEKNA
jgi:tetratricopeptide (TPR) repeat protein